MEIILFVIIALLGLATGSFLNVCIDRVPAGKSLVYPPSNCDACHHRLAPKDLIPVFSYLWLHGRCRYCGASIPRRVPLVELSTGLLFALAYWRYGISTELAVTAFYTSLFIVITFIDLERMLIPNKIVYPAAVVALIIDALLHRAGIVNDLIGGAVGFGLLLLPALIFRGGMGGGDIKMAGLIGLVTGFPRVFVAMLLGIILGGLMAGLLLLFGIRKRREAIPFGPFLALATIVTLLWGNELLSWYLRLLGIS